MPETTTEDRYLGCLLGLAAGDAVGTAVEFSPPGTCAPVTDMTGGGPFDLAPGEWTDDTSMALCLAESLVARGDFDPADQMDRYVAWWREGHLSSNGRCFDIGLTVHAALQRYLDNGNPYAGSTRPDTAGNGSIMRLAPVPMRFAAQPAGAVYWSGQSSRTTHGALTCIDACRYLGGLITGALRGLEKQSLLAPRFEPAAGIWATDPLCPEIDAIAAGSYKHKEPPGIAGTGYVVRSLEAALWAFHHSQSFAEGCLLAVNLGDDADTTAAVYGQLAGAYYGLGGIPPQWVEHLARRELIASLALRLHCQAELDGLGQEVEND